MKRLLSSALAVWALTLAAPVWAQTQDEPPATDETYQTETTTESSGSLPDTAGPLPLMAAAGVLAIGFGLRRLRSHE